jgi:hypothetical protein
MADRFEPADHCQEPGSEDRPFQLGAIGDVDVAVGILVDSQSVFCDMNRGVRQFNVLDDIEVTGGSQSETPHFAVIDFIVDRFVNPLRRQRLAQLLLMPRLTAPFAFLAASRLLLFRLRCDFATEISL